MRFFVSAIVFMMLSSTVWATEDYGPVPELFFTEYMKKNYAGAIDVLLNNQSVDPTAGQTDEQLRQTFTTSVSNLGNFEYKELVYTKEVGTRFVVLKYVIGMTKQPVMLRLNLYKPQDRWLVKGFNFDSDFEKAFNNLTAEKI